MVPLCRETLEHVVFASLFGSMDLILNLTPTRCLHPLCSSQVHSSPPGRFSCQSSLFEPNRRGRLLLDESSSCPCPRAVTLCDLTLIDNFLPKMIPPPKKKNWLRGQHVLLVSFCFDLPPALSVSSCVSHYFLGLYMLECCEASLHLFSFLCLLIPLGSSSVYV